jgi:hypothetical protein
MPSDASGLYRLTYYIDTYSMPGGSRSEGVIRLSPLFLFRIGLLRFASEFQSSRLQYVGVEIYVAK